MFLFSIYMLKHPKEYLDKWLNTESVSISRLNIPSNILVGCVAILSILVLWLSSQLFFSFAGNTTIDPRSLIVHQVRDVSELATAIFETETVIDASKKEGLLESKLLYIAHGGVRVGIDLSEFRDDDVQVEENKITVTLPPLRVLDTKLDVNQSRVYDYNKGFLNLGPDVVRLQESAQRDAINKLQEAACKDWLIKTASDRVQQIVQRFLNLVISDKGYTVTVKTQFPAESSCSKSTSNSAV